jgi:hypothetical protein
MATAGRFPSNHLSNVDAKPFSYGNVTVTEIHNELPLEDTPKSSPAAVQELSDTQPLAFDFAIELEHFRLSFEILNVLETYGRHIDLKGPPSKSTNSTEPEPSAWIGKHKFLPHVYHHVQQGQPVQLTLPAFPCKSVC